MKLYIILVMVSFVVSFLGTYVYRVIAIKNSVLAKPNFRTLHVTPIPKGGGVVLSLVFLIMLMILNFFKLLDRNLLLPLSIGGFLAILLGFIDDIIHVEAGVKFFIQGCLSAWVLFCFNGGPLVAHGVLPVWLSYFASWFLLVWLINLYNFMDGIDGMASSGTIFFCFALVLVSLIATGSLQVSLIYLILLATCLGFLLFNLPPASIFMGDSGSIFLGYCFGVFIIQTVSSGDVSFCTWLIILGYFIGDTTTTICLRVVTVKKWYGAHRSHAYQNLARILNSHMKVTAGVMFYQVFWLLPLAICSSRSPNYSCFAVVLAMLPVVCWTLKFGPLLSSS